MDRILRILKNVATVHLLAQLLNKFNGLFGERLIPSYLWSES